jgi:hypothetical protein
MTKQNLTDQDKTELKQMLRTMIEHVLAASDAAIDNGVVAETPLLHIAGVAHSLEGIARAMGSLGAMGLSRGEARRDGEKPRLTVVKPLGDTVH